MTATMKHMASNFAKLDKFEGVDFRIWQKKMHFLLSSMSVVYVLTTPMPDVEGDNPIVEQVKKRAKWDNGDYVYRGLILNGMSNSLFDIYQNFETSKELWDTLEAKYMAEDASSKKFLVSNFTNYKMTDSRPVLEQYNELLGILRRFTQHKMNMDESIQVSCIIDKLPPSWKDFKHTLKHLKEELTLVELGNHLLIEESLLAQDNDKPNGNNVVGPSVVNMVEHNNSSRYNDNRGKRKHHDTKVDPNKKPKVTCWKCGKPGHLKKDCKAGNLGNKANGSGTKGSVDGSSNSLKGATMHVCKDRCWFKTYESLNDGSILHMGNESTALVYRRGCVDLRTNRGGEYMDTLYFQSVGIIYEMTAPYTPQQNGIFERKNMVLKEMVNSMLSYLGMSQGFLGEAMAVVRLPDPKLNTLSERGIKCIFVGYAEHFKAFRFYRSLVNGTETIGGSVVPKKVNDKVVQQPEPELKKSKRHRTPKDFGPKFQLYMIEGTRDLISNQHSYCFNVEDNPKTFDEVMKSQDVVFWKEAINEEMDSIMGNNTWVLEDLPPGCKPLVCKWIFKRKLKAPKQWHQKFDKVVLSNGYLLNQADKYVYSKFDESGKGVIICLYVDDMLIFDIDQAVSQLKYSRVIGCLMYAMTCTRLDIAFVVGKLSRYTSNPGTQHWQAIQRALKYLKKIMDYRLIYTGYPSVLEGYTDASWISNTEDNWSTSGSVFLLAAGKEVEWLENLLLKIPLWVKPIVPISICCDNAATLAKAYSQMYNGKYRHLGVKHSMIRDLITNGWYL
ncbi:zinc finger, CCHC-type containing protein [Tanacetum coccineum]